MPRRSPSRATSVLLGALMIVGLMAIGAAPIGTSATAAQTGSIPAFIARLHGGTCDTWAPVAYAHQDATPAAGASAGAGATAPAGVIPAAGASTTVEAKLDDVAKQQHAIVVYRGTTESPDILACGDVGGGMEGDELLVGLREANGSDYGGVAMLRRHGIIRDHTELTVYLVPLRSLLGAEPTATAALPTPTVAPATATAETAQPTATQAPIEPPAATATPAGITVELTEFRFIPPSFTIPANTPTTVTLRNIGQILHNFSIDELRISQDVPPGETRTVTINAPAGTYQYYCDVPGHRAAGMVGTLTVS